MSSLKFLQKTDYLWEIPQEGKMRVPGRIYASKKMLNSIRADNAPDQVCNVAHLPGIVNYSLAMPDIHWGYGFSIGGVAAFDLDEGIISPGGVGYDINCGVRLLKTSLNRKDVSGHIKKIIDLLFQSIPTGVGSKGALRITHNELKRVMLDGAKWATDKGFGDASNLEFIEENGQMPGADPATVSERAMDRGTPQLGTLGSGNHFVELQYVDKIYDHDAATTLGLTEDQVTLTIHTGSRGFGYQICDDSIKKMLRASEKYDIYLPDKQLCCAPIRSPEGKEYLAAMACAINYAFANRQVISHWACESLESALGFSKGTIKFQLVYEVAHNIAKEETHLVDKKPVKLLVHRKGATRAFGPGSHDVPEKYRKIGQPVLIPGDMGRYSYVLSGTEGAMNETFGSTCHGAGRLLSRHKAIDAAKGRSIFRELEDIGIYVRSTGKKTLAEEMPEAYKDVSDVVDAVTGAGISNKIARLKPLGVIKG
ncbi:RtcB family protein [candidate division KSB1 bacterium]|nr:RtcB family protein [candidate division KSB1 bacterium]